jgi:hypothetical protein
MQSRFAAVGGFCLRFLAGGGNRTDLHGRPLIGLRSRQTPVHGMTITEMKLENSHLIF